MWAWVRRIVVALILIGAVLFWLKACDYNYSRKHLCEEHGLVMVQDYFSRDYGCGTFVEFKEVEE